MKHFLLITPDQATDKAKGIFTLSEEEHEDLPFSLLSAYPKAVITSDATPDTDTAEPTKEALTADTPAVDTATEDIPSDAAPTEDTPAEDTLSDEKTPIEAPSVLVMSDCDKTLAKAAEKRFATLKLPKRSFPLADTLLALPIENYELIVCSVSEPTDLDPSAIMKDRRTLTVYRPSDPKAAFTYRLEPCEMPSEPITADALSRAFFSEVKTPAPAPETPAPISHGIFEWLELFAISLAAVLLIMTFFIRHSPVSGSSMVPTLHNGDVLLLTQIGFTPETGDIVIIQTDREDLRRPLVKRVIAMGGQSVKIDFETWEIFVDGILLDEPYLDSTDKSEVMELYSIRQYFEKVDEHHAIYEATVPEGHLFVMGDNRQNSKDSRDLGFIDERHIIGEVIYRLLPFSAMGDPT